MLCLWAKRDHSISEVEEDDDEADKAFADVHQFQYIIINSLQYFLIHIFPLGNYKIMKAPYEPIISSIITAMS